MSTPWIRVVNKDGRQGRRSGQERYNFVHVIFSIDFNVHHLNLDVTLVRYHGRPLPLLSDEMVVTPTRSSRPTVGGTMCRRKER